MTFEEYNKEHECCPNCGSKNYVTTCKGYADYNDNKIECGCGWKGIGHELISYDLYEEVIAYMELP